MSFREEFVGLRPSEAVDVSMVTAAQLSGNNTPCSACTAWQGAHVERGAADQDVDSPA